jgi:hypothetical protein
MLTTEAYRAAADPAQFPEQIREDLRPWQVQKFYRPIGFGGRGGRGAPGQRGGGRGPGQAQPPPNADGPLAALDLAVYEPLLGCTINEVGSIASGMHMCQGRVPMVAPPNPAVSRYRLVESASGKPAVAETSLFDGLDVSLPGLAKYAGNQPPAALVSGLAALDSRVDAATKALETRGPTAAVPDLAGGLTTVRSLLGQIGSMGLSESARFEIEPRLRLKETQIEDAIAIAQALRIDALASDGLIVAGQAVTVSVAVANRGGGEVPVTSVTLSGFDSGSNCPRGNAAASAAYSCSAEVRTPPNARLTDVYWQRPEDAGRSTFDADAPFGLPFRPSPFTARVELEIGGARISRQIPIQFRYEGAGLVGEKRMELKVVPAFAVSVSPRIAVVPARTGTVPRELRVTVTNGNKGAASATVRLKAPAGWRVNPPSMALSFSREDESTTTRFTIAPPAAMKNGEAEITAEVTTTNSGDATRSYEIGYQAIEYPHINRRHKLIPATARVKVIDVAVAPGLSVGYIMGVGDQVPPALQQLGARVSLIDSDEMAWGDLSKYHTIVTGVRAYEQRADLRANNHRLLKYVENGGTVLVQYNRMEFNQAQYGPYKAVVSSDRITDEYAPVKVLAPSHPAFTYPNRIGAHDWDGWVQERGTYFLGEKDPHYVDLVEMEDPFPYNRGVKRGALVDAKFGKGRWMYVGLVLWRQLPSGTDGAYRLFANLISLGKAPTPAKPIVVER